MRIVSPFSLRSCQPPNKQLQPTVIRRRWTVCATAELRR